MPGTRLAKTGISARNIGSATLTKIECEAYGFETVAVLNAYSSPAPDPVAIAFEGETTTEVI